MTAPAARIDALDVLRGVAVMGILAANVPAFALPEAAYFSPAAWGGLAPADIAAWFATYVFIEGKMRGLFSLLFGASMLLVVQRAEAAGRSGAAVHYRRMASLFALGCLHLYGLWWGDILTHYALCGAVAFLFVGMRTRNLVAVALLLIVLQIAQVTSLYAAAIDAQRHSSPGGAKLLADLALGFGTPPPARLAAEIQAYRGSYLQALAWRWHDASSPLDLLPIIGSETLATMLLGMAGLKSGFLTGTWSRRRYRISAIALLGVSLPAYAAVGLHTMRGNFALTDVMLGSYVLHSVLRWPAIVGYAALIMILMRPDGWWTRRVAAAGRVALSNYLGTTIVMTTVFYGYGLGLFGRLSRAESYLVVLPLWAIMLLWSKPWLERHRHGPAESLWRTLAGFAPRRASDATGGGR